MIKETNSIPIIAEFNKVSLAQFIKDYKDNKLSPKEIYEDILKLPVRSSIDSAGHDFVLTKDINLKPGASVVIETGINVKIATGWVLLILPRSGLGVKFRVQLNNTVGVIDGDYIKADNEGHILITITNDSKEGKSVVLKAGDRFVQGIFVPYGITNHDSPLGLRTGGHGSSGL